MKIEVDVGQLRESLLDRVGSAAGVGFPAAMLDVMETVAVKGEFENGNRIFLYLSDIDLESSYSYVTTSRHQAVNIGMFSLNGLRTPDPLMYEYVKKWIKTQSRFSTLISGSGELRRIHYFKRQREIVAQLG